MHAGDDDYAQLMLHVASVSKNQKKKETQNTTVGAIAPEGAGPVFVSCMCRHRSSKIRSAAASMHSKFCITNILLWSNFIHLPIVFGKGGIWNLLDLNFFRMFIWFLKSITKVVWYDFMVTASKLSVPNVRLTTWNLTDEGEVHGDDTNHKKELALFDTTANQICDGSYRWNFTGIVNCFRISFLG
ncbi:hypothetical protein ACJX0J_014840 [Zea mays]